VVKLFCDPPYSAGWLVSRVRPPALQATFVIKGAFVLNPGAPAEPAPEPALVIGDIQEGDDPAKVLKYASDLAPLKLRTDLLLNAVCHAPGGKSATVLRAGFRVGAFAKSVAVIGDRRWVPGILSTSQTEPAPFKSMPITWERAYGGAKYRKNPVGRGRVKEAGELPNIEHVDRLLKGPGDALDPAGFGPVDPSWEPRANIKGTFKDKWLKERWPWFPEDFDFGYFNAAPLDQQLAAPLKGDEEISFDNLHPTHPKYASRLPGVRARGFVSETIDGKPSFREVPLKIDTLWIDLEEGRLLLTWRGMIDVRTLKLKEIASFLVRVEPLKDSPVPVDKVRAEHEAKLAAAALPEPEEPEEVAEPEEPAPPPPPPVTADTVRAALAAGESLANAELSRADLSGVDLSGRDLQGAELVGASLRKAKLAGANLAGAILSGADLTEADLSGAILVGADFTGAKLGKAILKMAKLDKAEFETAALGEADLDEAEGAGVSFCKANLAGAKLRKATLTKSDFSGSTVERADFTGAVLSASGFEGAKLAGAIFRGAEVATFRVSTGADARKADFRETKGAKTVWTEANFDGADFSGANLPAADFTDSSLAGAIFKRAEVVSGQFADANLRKAQFPQVNLLRACFERADLGGADFQGSNLFEAEFWDAKVQGADFRGANLKRTKLG
jgi:uncharacterized protein YjbI with pentapeptide repeats